MKQIKIMPDGEVRIAFEDDSRNHHNNMEVVDMANGNPQNQFVSNTPDICQGIETRMDAISLIGDAVRMLQAAISLICQQNQKAEERKREIHCKNYFEGGA